MTRVSTMHATALALEEQGQLAAAATAFEEALGAADDDLDLLASAAEFYLEHADEAPPGAEWLERAVAIAARGTRLAGRHRDAQATADFALLEARALEGAGLPDQALARIEAALQSSPDDLDLLAERGLLLFELCRLEEARDELRAILRTEPDDPWVNQTLGLIAERCGDSAEAELRFARARREAPDEFPAPPRLSGADFDAAVEDALASLPSRVKEYLSNVAITVEDLPADDDLLASDPPLSPTVLGMFRGSPLGEKASMDPWSHFPSSIVLYQKNLERFAADRDDLVDEIGITLLHEVGHFLGLDEDDLRKRGLD